MYVRDLCLSAFPRFLTLVPCFLPSSLFSFPLPTWSTLRAWGGFRAPGAEPPSPSANRKASLRLLQNDLRAGPSLFSRKTRLSPSLLAAGNRPSSPPRCAREIPVGPPEANLGEHGVLSSPSPANLLSSWRGTQGRRGPRGPPRFPQRKSPARLLGGVRPHGRAGRPADRGLFGVPRQLAEEGGGEERRGLSINVSVSRLTLAETVSLLLACGGIFVETELFGLIREKYFKPPQRK